MADTWALYRWQPAFVLGFYQSVFRAKNHIQVCVINTAHCIKGYFKPIQQAK